jgi:hypothetical protein
MKSLTGSSHHGREVSAAELSFNEDATTEELSSLALSFRLEKRVHRVQNVRIFQRQKFDKRLAKTRNLAESTGKGDIAALLSST